MSKTKIVLALLAVTAAAGTAWYLLAERANAPAVWRLGKIEHGPLSAVVSSTGTLAAVVTVQVGSQISGQIKELYVDFNSEVRRGQVIARIDPEAFELAVNQASADLEAARATVLTQLAGVGAQRANVQKETVNAADAKRDYERKETLAQKGFISTAERDKSLATFNAATEQLNTARAQLTVAEAQAKNAEALVKQREAQLAGARVNLDRTYIRAPVDGVVIKRSVDAGQTVAASLQAPELFVIARSLADMQVEAAIDEADVGRISVGQRVSFTVDSFAGRGFSGEVKQVRKAAQVVQNVVTYTVVIGTANPELLLLPGMTANVRIVTDQRENALKVPNAALRFRPPSGVVVAGAGGDGPLRTTAPSAGGADKGAGFRQRLDQELKLTPEQQTRADPLFADLRAKMGALPELPEAERGRASERARAEFRARLTELLDPAQRARYESLAAEMGGRPAAGRQAARGRVHVVTGEGLRAIDVRLGISDGSMTELIQSGDLKEGDTVVIGSSAQAGTPRPSGPRLPF